MFEGPQDKNQGHWYTKIDKFNGFNMASITIISTKNTRLISSVSGSIYYANY